MLPLPRPVGGGNLDELRGFVNVPDERTWILLVYWHIGCFHPRGPYPVLVLQGEHGSGKATLRVLRELIDPNLSATRTTPRDERDLAIAAKNAWVVALDNLSGLQTWLSDALCRLSTGAGFSTRRLYTDDEETLFYAKRPVVVNGIDEIINRNDLLDRSLIVNLPTIPETQRKREDEFWQEFKKARPFLLGALYDAIQIALANRNLVVLDKLPRMADFAAWVVAAEPALPWDSGGFIAAYSGMREDAVSLALEEDTIAQGVIRLVKDEPWEGTATDLLAALEELAGTKITASKSWPKSPRTLSNRLRRAATFLRQGANIEIEFERQPRSGKRLIRISKQNSVSTVTSVAREQKSLLSGTFNGDDKGDAKLQTSEFASHPASQ